MINWFQRQLLVRKGLACDKQRLKFDVSGWGDQFDTNPVARVLLCLLYTAVIFIFGTWHHDHITASLLLLLSILVGCALMLLSMDLPEAWRSNSRLLIIFGSICLNLLMSKCLFVWSTSQKLTIPSDVLFLVPMVFAPILLSVLMGTRTGLYAVIVASLTDSLLINQSPPFALLVISLVTGFTAVFFTRHVRRRSKLVRTGFAVGVSSFICAMAFGFVSGTSHMGDVLFQQALLSILVGVTTAFLINSLLPMLESVFNISTEITWVEMSDLNHPLLRQMSLEAPGTYHHSLAVANLAEAAAVAIGANGTLCRVMAYFHDIGKIPKPGYFIENTNSEDSLHSQLTPQMSALVIAAHVKEGVSLAIKYRLKKCLIDAIQQHHGDSLIYYFYRRAQQLTEDAKAGSEIMNLREADIPDVAEQTFRYPGPRPQTKEIGLLMLADCIEASSRSLEKPTPQRIEELVDDVIKQRMDENQLDECPITLEELRISAVSFTFTLKTMLHSRINYPKHASLSNTTSSLQSTRRIQAAPEETRDITTSRA